MQDKDFDQLFKERFDEAEIMPSADLWSSIEQEIVPKRKHKFPFYWMAAAAVMAVVAVGLVFNRPQKIQLQGSGVASVPTSVAADRAMDKARVTARAMPAVDVQVESAAIVARNERVNTESVKKDFQPLQPVEQISRHLPKDVLMQQAKDEAPSLNELQPVLAKEEPKEEVVLALNDVPVVTADALINDNEEVGRKGIRNVGDLINYVVDKVDKREEKVIEFKTDDDDNSSIIGINLGMLKFNNRKHK